MRYYVAMSAHNRGTVIRRAKGPVSREDLPEGFQVYAIGPFRTLQGAQICASGEHSPSVQCVAQFEWLAVDRGLAPRLSPREILRYHICGAIERGEAQAIEEKREQE